MQNEVRYMISDAAKQVEVETHVLRYWEEELDMPIGRNEMGHRYYTGKDILIFKNIKKLKDQGFQLKAIKMVLPELEQNNVDKLLTQKEELNTKADSILDKKETELMIKKENYEPAESDSDSRNHRVQQFQLILNNLIQGALEENNQILEERIADRVEEKVVKQMNFLVREQDEREEERYKKLDEVIRNYQKNRKDVSQNQKEEKRKRGFFRRKVEAESAEG